MKKSALFFLAVLFPLMTFASYVLIPMDAKSQANHLKAYGITYWVLARHQKAKWLLNYRGGSFLMPDTKALVQECKIRGVSYEILSDAKTKAILDKISSPSQNMAAVVLEKAPKIAVYTPKDKPPWDDAVTMALTYAEIPYDKIYDKDILSGKLAKYDWLHLHHEDFTGQYGKFYGAYRSAPWYIKQKKDAEALAHELGFKKVSKEKLAVAQKIKQYVIGGGFMFAMCSATDSFDIALAAQDTDICEAMFDGDPSEPGYQNKLDFSQTFAFTNFTLERNPMVYDFSNIDMTHQRHIPRDLDYFSLRTFSAKWDPIPTMLTQDHTRLIKGFMGQTTSFNPNCIKSTVTIMGRNKRNGEAKYIYGTEGKGFFTFYGGHDPEDYAHRVGDPKTKLSLHPNSPGYRLILNNVLFPAAKPKKHKT